MQKTFSKLTTVVSNATALSLQFTLLVEILSQIQLMHLVIATSTSTDNGQNENFDLFTLLRSFTTISGSFDFFGSSASRTQVYAILSGFGVYSLFQILVFTILTVQIIKKININARFAQIIANFSLLHSRVFFFLILYSLFGLIHHSTAFCEDNLMRHEQCRTGMLVIALVLSLCSIGIAIIQEFFFYRINKNKNTYGTKNNHIHKIVLFHKLLGLIAHIFLSDSPLKVQVISIGNLLLVTCSMYIIYKKLPFYHLKVLKSVVLMTAINFSLAMISIIKAFYQDLEVSESGLLICSLVIVKFHWNYFHKILERILEGETNTPEKAIHLVILMKESNLGSPSFPAFKRKFKRTSIFANGYMRKEGIDTVQISDAQTAKDYERQAYTHFIKKLVFLLERNPESEVLALYIANLYLKKVGNVFMAANILEKLKQRELSIPAQNSVENMDIHLKKVCHKIYANSDYSLELNTYFEYKKKTEALRKIVDQEVFTHIQFWQELGSKKPSVLKIVDLTSKIDQFELKILPQSKKYSQEAPSKFTPFLLLQASYLQIIKEIPHEASKILKKLQAQAIYQTEAHIFDVNSNKVGVVVISLNKGRVGTILNLSASIQNLFHFQKTRLVGSTIHLLLPKFVADKYIRTLENSLREPTTLLKNFRTYAKTKENEYFEVEIQFQLYPHHIYGLILLAIFKKVSSAKSIIVTDDHNIIQEYSKDLQESFHFESSKQMHYRLEDILPEFGPASYLLHCAANNSEHFSQRGSIPGNHIGSDFIKSFSIFKPAAPEQPKTQLDDSTASLSQIKASNDEVPFIRRRNRTRSQFLTIISSGGNDHQTLADLYFNKSEHSNCLDEDDQALARPIKLKFYPLYEKEFPIEYNVRVRKFRTEERYFRILVLSLVEEDIAKKREQISPGFGPKPLQPLNDSFEDSFPEEEERPEGSPSKQEGRQIIGKQDLELGNIDKSKISSSILSRNLSNKFQNILDGKQEKGALPAIVNKIDTEDRSSHGFYRQRVARSIKTLKNVFNSKQSPPLSRFTTLVFYLIILCLIVLAGVNFSLSQNSFYQTSHGLQIVDAANQRLACTFGVWAKLLMIMERATDIMPDPLVAKVNQEAVYTNIIHIIEKNNELYGFFETNSKNMFVEKAFDRDVKFWKTVGNQSVNVFEGNTFAATNFLANNYLDIANSSDVFGLSLTEDFLNILNNTANDYLLSSEEMISTTHDLLGVIIGEKKGNLNLVIVLASCGLVVILCILFALSWRIVQSYKKLFSTLMKIPERHISQRLEQLENVRLSLKLDINTKEFANSQIQLLNKNTERVKLAQLNSLSERHLEGSYWIQHTLKHIVRYIGVTVLCLILISGMFLNSFLRTLPEFNTLEDINEQLAVAAEGVYQTNMVLANFYFNIMLQNQSNVLIRNSPPDDQLTYSLTMVSQLNQKLLKAFINGQSGINDPVIESILKNNICDLIIMPEQIRGHCENATKGDTLGLLSLITDYHYTSLQYVNLYRQNRTLSNAKDLLKLYGNSVITTLPVLQYAFQFLTSYVLSDLDIKVEGFVQQEVLQLCILIGVITICTALIRVFVLRKLMFLDVGKRRIWKNVPYYAIQENRFLKFYLVREYNQELLGIKNIL